MSHLFSLNFSKNDEQTLLTKGEYRLVQIWVEKILPKTEPNLQNRNRTDRTPLITETRTENSVRFDFSRFLVF